MKGNGMNTRALDRTLDADTRKALADWFRALRRAGFVRMGAAQWVLGIKPNGCCRAYACLWRDAGKDYYRFSAARGADYTGPIPVPALRIDCSRATRSAIAA